MWLRCSLFAFRGRKGYFYRVTLLTFISPTAWSVFGFLKQCCVCWGRTDTRPLNLRARREIEMAHRNKGPVKPKGAAENKFSILSRRGHQYHRCLWWSRTSARFPNSQGWVYPFNQIPSPYLCQKKMSFFLLHRFAGFRGRESLM